MSLLPETARFQATVGIINGVDVAKFPAVLTRVIRKLHTKGEAFSEDEAAQLAGMFGLSGEQLNQLLDGCTFMFEQFTYNVAKPAAVSAALEKAGFSEEHANAVSTVWVAEAEPLLKRVQSEQFGPRTLDSISWSLNLQSSEDTQGRMSKPTAVMELELKAVDAGPDGTQDVEHVAIEASHDELHSMFESMERIQEQLDAIS